MCGLISAISLNKEKFNNSERALQQYKSQRIRGRSGFGFISFNKDKKETVLYRTRDEDKIKERLGGDDVQKSDILMFHHRLPTSSPNTPLSNHPIPINHKELKHKYFLIHNGSVSNDYELRKEHEKLGIKYNTDVKVRDRTSIYYRHNDSEALGIELALLIEGKKDKFEARGRLACFLLQMNKENTPTSLIYFTNCTNPIRFYRNQAGIFFSSEGKGEKIPMDTLFHLNLSTYKTTSIRWSVPIISQHDSPSNRAVNALLGENNTHALPPTDPYDAEQEFLYSPKQGLPYDSHYVGDLENIIYTSEDGVVISADDIRWLTHQIISLTAEKDSLKDKMSGLQNEYSYSSDDYYQWHRKNDELTETVEELEDKQGELRGLAMEITKSGKIKDLLGRAKIDNETQETLLQTYYEYV